MGDESASPEPAIAVEHRDEVSSWRPAVLAGWIGAGAVALVWLDAVQFFVAANAGYTLVSEIGRGAVCTWAAAVVISLGVLHHCARFIRGESYTYSTFVQLTIGAAGIWLLAFVLGSVARRQWLFYEWRYGFARILEIIQFLVPRAALLLFMWGLLRSSHGQSTPSKQETLGEFPGDQTHG